MEKFIINGKLGSDKSLALVQDINLSQGENLSTVLHIELPDVYNECVFQIEFECPNGYSYCTPILTPISNETVSHIEYQLESCIMQYSGGVLVQVLCRQSSTDEVLWKSTVSQCSRIEVSPSVNASGQSYARKDFYAEAYSTMNELQVNSDDLKELQNSISTVQKSCDEFLQEYQAKLESGELRGDKGATVVSIVETGKDSEGNGIYTITMSDGGQFNFTVPAGKKGDKGDKGDTGLTGEYIVSLEYKQTLGNGDKEYIITTNMNNKFSFVVPKGDKGESITALNHTATDEVGNRTYTFVSSGGNEYSFVVPKGDKGEQGIQGEKGEKGEKGDTPILEGTHESLTAGKAIADSEGNIIAETYAKIGDKIDENTIKQMLLQYCYPVGTIYESTKNISPASFLGGSWTAYGLGRVLVGNGSNGTKSYTANAIGGAVNHSHQYGIQVGEYYNSGIFDRDNANLGLYNYSNASSYNINKLIWKGATTGGKNSGILPSNTETTYDYVGNVANVSYASTEMPYIVVYRWQRTA